MCAILVEDLNVHGIGDILSRPKKKQKHFLKGAEIVTCKKCFVMKAPGSD